MADNSRLISKFSESKGTCKILQFPKVSKTKANSKKQALRKDGHVSHYDAYTGRWMNRDPILFAGGDTNLYGYALQDPVNFFDSSGRIRLNAAGAAVGFISGAIGGFSTGGWQGAMAGSVAGAGIGAFNPLASYTAGAAAGGAAASLAAQVFGNALGNKPLLTIDPSLVAAGAFAGGTSALAVGGLGISNSVAEGAIGGACDAASSGIAQKASPGPYDFGKLFGL